METIFVIQGEELLRKYESANNRTKFILNNYKVSEENYGKIIVKEFDTAEEKHAYIQGIEDCEGWNKTYLIQNEKAEEISKLLKSSRVYIVRDNFYQEDLESNCDFKIFAGENSYNRAMIYLIGSANARDTFLEFVEKEGDFRNNNLYWEIEEQTLEMWSAETIDVFDTILELGDYTKNFG